MDAEPSLLSGMEWRKTIEFVGTGLVNWTYWPWVRATALRLEASSASWPWV